MSCGWARSAGARLRPTFAVLIISAVAIAAAPKDASSQQGQAGSGAPEQRTFDGRVIGPDGDAVSGIVVLLHRVTNQGGAQLARSVTTEDGRFSLQYEPPSDAGGVYFVATRYDGSVYVGPMLRVPFADTEEYVVQVGVPGVGDVEALMGGAAPATGVGSEVPASQPPAPGAVFVAVMLSAAIAIGAVLVVRGTGPSRRRRALIGLAELEEAGPSSTSPSAFAHRQRDLLRRTREA